MVKIPFVRQLRIPRLWQPNDIGGGQEALLGHRDCPHQTVARNTPSNVKRAKGEAFTQVRGEALTKLGEGGLSIALATASSVETAGECYKCLQRTIKLVADEGGSSSKV